ncbi:MAG: hypothetical protein ABR585_07830 [Gemmatimonadaceae bacterium]
MPIGIDASTPALVSSDGACTTASFTAPAGSLLVALCAAGDGAGTNTVTNSGAALTWATRVNHQAGVDAGAYDATVLIATAVANAAVARTVTLTASNGALVNLKLLVVTGASLSDPVGATGEGHSTTSNLTAAAYTSTVEDSRAVGIAADTSSFVDFPTSSDVGFSFAELFAYAGIAVYKAANTGAAGSAVTLNFNGNEETRTWNWAAIEIKPATGIAPPPQVISQAALIRSFNH